MGKKNKQLEKKNKQLEGSAQFGNFFAKKKGKITKEPAAKFSSAEKEKGGRPVSQLFYFNCIG